MTDTAIDTIVDRSIEQQGETFLRIREQSLVPIAAAQYAILQEQRRD